MRKTMKSSIVSSQFPQSQNCSLSESLRLGQSLAFPATLLLPKADSSLRSNDANTETKTRLYSKYSLRVSSYLWVWVHAKFMETRLGFAPSPTRGSASGLRQEPGGPWTPESPSVYVPVTGTYTEGAWECHGNACFLAGTGVEPLRESEVNSQTSSTNLTHTLWV